MSAEQQIRSELRYLVRELGLLGKNCLSSGLSLTQVHILTYLRKNGTTPFSELCIHLNVEKASLSRTINTLLDKNYLDVVSEGSDKRQKSFTLTYEGLNTLEQADHSANGELSSLTGFMGAKETQTVIDGLRSLRLSAFRKNATQNKARIQIEELKPTYYSEIESLLHDAFAIEQGIPSNLVPLSADIPHKWWLARSGEYVLGAVASWQENGKWHWGRFVVDNRFRGLGIGKALAQFSIAVMLKETEELQIDARDTTVNIIKQLGGEILGDKVNFYGMPVTPMRITRRKHHHERKAKELNLPFEMPKV